MALTGWGKYPSINSEIISPHSNESVLTGLPDNIQSTLIARGLGRSYGDSSLASHVISTARLDHFINFDKTTGLLTCSAGVCLSDVLSVFVPKGWFLPVTPGTKFITVGGAVASDVHGKNHHQEGSFADHVVSLKIVTGTIGITECSRELRSELFYATCGGMGLTGIILEVTFKLKPIQSAYINETIIKAKNLEGVLALFEEYQDRSYSVAWIDCLSVGQSLGKSLFVFGEHATHGELALGKKRKLVIPVDMPGILLNRYSIRGYSIRAFNFLYYHRIAGDYVERLVHYESFFSLSIVSTNGTGYMARKVLPNISLLYLSKPGCQG